MQSEFIALHCPCGCELSAEHRLECLYGALLFNFSANEITGLVSCEQGTNSKLMLQTTRLPDKVNKTIRHMLGVMTFDYSVVYDNQYTWVFDVNKKGGLTYESI